MRKIKVNLDSGTIDFKNPKGITILRGNICLCKSKTAAEYHSFVTSVHLVGEDGKFLLGQPTIDDLFPLFMSGIRNTQLVQVFQKLNINPIELLPNKWPKLNNDDHFRFLDHISEELEIVGSDSNMKLWGRLRTSIEIDEINTNLKFD